MAQVDEIEKERRASLDGGAHHPLLLAVSTEEGVVVIEDTHQQRRHSRRGSTPPTLTSPDVASAVHPPSTPPGPLLLAVYVGLALAVSTAGGVVSRAAATKRRSDPSDKVRGPLSLAVPLLLLVFLHAYFA